jgi:hypothetical protein
MRTPSPAITERDFALYALKQSLRLHGWSTLEMRAPSFQFGPKLGRVECALGKTWWVNLAFFKYTSTYPSAQRRNACRCEDGDPT